MITLFMAVGSMVVCGALAVIWWLLRADVPAGPVEPDPVPHTGADEAYAAQLREWVASIDPVVDFATAGSGEVFRSPTRRAAAVVPAPLAPPMRPGRHRVTDLPGSVPDDLASYSAWLAAGCPARSGVA